MVRELTTKHLFSGRMHIGMRRRKIKRSQASPAPTRGSDRRKYVGAAEGCDLFYGREKGRHCHNPSSEQLYLNNRR
jgi:hypothetical protein